MSERREGWVRPEAISDHHGQGTRIQMREVLPGDEIINDNDLPELTADEQRAMDEATTKFREWLDGNEKLKQQHAALVAAANWAREFVDYHWPELEDMRVVTGDDVVALDRLVKALEASK